MSDKKTAIVTGASRGIGAGLVAAFLKEGYNVVATSLDVSQSLTASPSLVLVDGDIGKQETAAGDCLQALRLGHAGHGAKRFPARLGKCCPSVRQYQPRDQPRVTDRECQGSDAWI